MFAVRLLFAMLLFLACKQSCEAGELPWSLLVSRELLEFASLHILILCGRPVPVGQWHWETGELRQSER